MKKGFMYKYDITYWDEDTHEDIRDQGITYLSVDETELNEIPLMSKFVQQLEEYYGDIDEIHSMSFVTDFNVCPIPKDFIDKMEPIMEKW